jgi:hypothetical protein
VEESVFVLESYLKTISYAHCRQSFFEKFRRQPEAATEVVELLMTGVKTP